MSVMSFLGGLPALLGIAGFFAYIWVGQSKIGGDILKDIVAKLRNNPNLDPKAYGELSPVKLGRLSSPMRRSGTQSMIKIRSCCGY